ncbi:Putative peptidase S8/S53 domain, Galactose-binding-like domain superfamily [Septoria linicola]|uniref:Peptidase S8/S53 domain, Galactose-binding-like domain superfamily n=1 Tax=Septoria linicola TaxID=215465 RepID=A0A9Q9ASN9_9PEZI|nr:Putative peptidase S8/S53 domain, Galactose-binding-like domain superfamily [Septoria linicola]
MKWSSLVPGLLAATACAADTPRRIRDYDAYDYYAVHLNADQDPQQAATEIGLQYDGPLGELDDHYLFRTADRQHDYDHIQTLKSDLKRRRRTREAGAEAPHVLDSVQLSKKQELHKRFPLVKRGAPSDISYPRRQKFGAQPVEWAVNELNEVALNLSIADPIFKEQWHLYNPVEVGHDINVTGVWTSGVTGKNINTCIVDDGLDFHSNDLKASYFAAGSWDYNDPGPDPLPRLSDDRHGTRCAGEISAVRNDVCGVGVAYDGKVAGVRILSKVISDADEAEAMNYAYQQNHIYSCSWGPSDDGTAMEAPGILIRRSMVQGIQKGRGGLGSIYVFAIGNGASNDDNCNFDGYTNSIYSVSVGGIDRKGQHPYYSEKCSAQLVVTYSSGSGDAIHTTDVGENQCYVSHGGTSAAGPLVAGIYALMLEVNSKLTWRDIQWITVLNAVKIDQGNDWQTNTAVGRDFSHQFGYGKADAWAFVEAARDWKNVKPQAWYFSPWLHVKKSIPQGQNGLASSFDVTEEHLKEANLERVEHVTVTMNVKHTRRGDLSVDLISPTGMKSEIATHRRNDNANSGYVDWTFMSVAHWGETGVGKWTVIVKDTRQNEHEGTFIDWHFKLWGEAIDGEKQPLLPMPTDHDDDDHDVYIVPTQTATAHTTSVAHPTDVDGQPAGNPSDHPERPTKPKPTKPADTEAQETPGAVEGDKEEASKPTESASAGNENLLPSIFPTFGVSKKTQTWIYGSIGLIFAFLIGLGVWVACVRRKQRRVRNLSEFELVDQDDADESAPLAANGRANGKARNKGRDLYNAFAEGSDTDEAEAFDIGSDEEDEHDNFGEGSSSENSRGSNDRAHPAKNERYRDDEPEKVGLDT